MDVIVYDKLDGIAKGVEYNGGGYIYCQKRCNGIAW